MTAVLAALRQGKTQAAVVANHLLWTPVQGEFCVTVGT